MEKAEKCPVCADGIPATGAQPTPCPGCGRQVQQGMVLQTGKNRTLVWDYARFGPLPGTDPDRKD
jgi:predicted RNA-binding Zn-ribbon protein involved in translation (DUF1610 family)